MIEENQIPDAMHGESELKIKKKQLTCSRTLNYKVFPVKHLAIDSTDHHNHHIASYYL